MAIDRIVAGWEKRSKEAKEEVDEFLENQWPFVKKLSKKEQERREDQEDPRYKLKPNDRGGW